jgi:hypothetical protein
MTQLCWWSTRQEQQEKLDRPEDANKPRVTNNQRNRTTAFFSNASLALCKVQHRQRKMPTSGNSRVNATFMSCYLKLRFSFYSSRILNGRDDGKNEATVSSQWPWLAMLCRHTVAMYTHTVGSTAQPQTLVTIRWPIQLQNFFIPTN